MGHHFSKPAVRVASQDKNKSNTKQQRFEEEAQQVQLVEEIVAQTDAASSEVRQIIIKIQLAKMENGNNGGQQQQEEEQVEQGVAAVAVAAAVMSADTLNANEQQIVVEASSGVEVGSGAVSNRTAGSSTEAPKTERQQLVNNNNLAGSGVVGVVGVVGHIVAEAAISTLQLNDDDDDVNDDDDDVDESLLRRRHHHSHSPSHEAEVVEYCEVLESLPVSEMLSTGAQHTSPSGTNTNNTNNSNSKQAPRGSAASGNSCCRSRSSKALSMGATESTAAAAAAGAPTSSKRRCCKCKCRDAFRGFRDMLDSSKDKKEANTSASTSASASAVTRKSRTADRRSTPPTLSGASGSGLGITQQRLQAQRKRNSVAVPEPSQLAIWTAPANGDVIIRISSPQFVVESPNARVTVGPNIRLVTETTAPAQLQQQQPLQQQQQVDPPVRLTYGRRSVTVHSQIDFMHCLVPDLERIINSSFYWGKMDRYEAEHLLEGKPEGTFLLRDSAQEEFLFSVTFRKYGRSLHARIEQSGHKFSFDCHDPCVFTAPTVTGLLEHYKDPSCVMFFEPCLTMPLHRRQTFSLQQLARATIVSNTSYDGINQLELPGRLKSYLKEYHYKQKLRVKPCDAHTPAPFYGNV
ncbi:uncharacterized protein LOC117900173 [Drosophila subobscura]|uniref:uncharacterized protein LOC117900173 n=1 Tax=Drosophila subobscura TaxID=7241 RepID=UPI00155AF42E|nr:uncharacterized protein LOC117900173 [Drosophila subobscura]